jgi:hypothetical protein
MRVTPSVCAYADDPDDGRTLFVLGEAITLEDGCESLGPLVCGTTELTADVILPLLHQPDASRVLHRLLELGFLEIVD